MQKSAEKEIATKSQHEITPIVCAAATDLKKQWQMEMNLKTIIGYGLIKTINVLIHGT